MASIMRPSMLRQACTAASSRRMASSFAGSSLKHTSPLNRPLQSAFVRDALPAKRIAAFHATPRQAILPPLAQKIEGTLNDPAPVPMPDYAHGSYHWSFERIISAGLIPLTVAPFAAGSLNPATDAFLCALLVIHSHIGFETNIIDYFPKKRVPKTRAVLIWVLRLTTVLTGVFLYQFETNDIGLTEAIKRIWHA